MCFQSLVQFVKTTALVSHVVPWGFFVFRIYLLGMQCSHQFPWMFSFSHSYNFMFFVCGWCNYILGSSRPVFRVGFPPHVCTCRVQLYLQLQAVSHCIAPHSLLDANNTACVCVVVMTKLWWWWFCDAEKERWWIANVRDGQSQGEFPECILEGGWKTLWCASSFKILALCLKARGVTPAVGDRGEKWSSGVIVMEMYWPFKA